MPQRKPGPSVKDPAEASRRDRDRGRSKMSKGELVKALRDH